MVLRPYQEDAVDRVLLALRSKRGVILVAPTGCVTGDTMVTVNRAGKGFAVPMERLVPLLRDEPVFVPGPRGGQRQIIWRADIPTRTASVDDDGFLRLNDVAAGWSNGVAEVWTLRTAGGRSIRATAGHGFLTPDGFAPLRDLRVGGRVMAETWPAAGARPTRPKALYRMVDRLQFHPHANCTISPRDGELFRAPLHRLVAEARLNGITVEALIEAARFGPVDGLQFLDPAATHVHHIDGDHRNNAPDNLEVLSVEEHLRRHGSESAWRHVCARAAPDPIVHLERSGEEPTFDLTMLSPRNSYVANGLVVHNSGKTVMARAIAERTRGRTLIYAHRKELVSQARNRVPSAEVMSIQAANLRPPVDDIALVFVDEAHHAAADSYGKVLAKYPRAKVVGLTATPWRTDKKGLGDLFEQVIVAATPAQLIADGSLCPYEAFAYEAPNVDQVKVRAGDFAINELGAVTNTAKLRGSVVREYLAHGHMARAICFAVNVEHSMALVAEFRAAGVPAEHLDWSTPELIRARILRELSTGAVRVVSNMGILCEGFDEPRVGVVICARPTASLTLHLQQIGRGLRPAPGKARCLVHDHAGNLMRHGFPDEHREMTLGPTPEYHWRHHTCPFCKVLFARLVNGNCPKCGAALGQHVERSLQERRRKLIAEEAERLDKERIKAAREEWARTATTSQMEKVYRGLVATAMIKGYKPGWADVQFKNRFGFWPRFGRRSA